MKIRLGTRGSQLARAQSGMVGRRLEDAGHEVETIVVETTGDRDRDSAFSALGAPGVFVREIERALLEERIDLAVHSYKDLPSDSPEGLVIAAVPERRDPADVLVVRPDVVDRDAEGLLPLPRGARVGTGAARRQAILHDLRPDLEVGLLRGNVPTRLEKLRDGEHDAILLAAAGLQRLDDVTAEIRRELVEVRLDTAIFVPAPSQGALALQVHESDLDARRAVGALDDAVAHHSVRAERRLLKLVEGGCHIPFGAWCRADQDDASLPSEPGDEMPLLRMTGVFGVEGTLRRAEHTGRDPMALADELARELKGRG